MVAMSTWPAYARPVPPVADAGIEAVIIGNLHDPNTAYENPGFASRVFFCLNVRIVGKSAVGVELFFFGAVLKQSKECAVVEEELPGRLPCDLARLRSLPDRAPACHDPFEKLQQVESKQHTS